MMQNLIITVLKAGKCDKVVFNVVDTDNKIFLMIIFGSGANSLCRKRTTFLNNWLRFILILDS